MGGHNASSPNNNFSHEDSNVPSINISEYLEGSFGIWVLLHRIVETMGKGDIERVPAPIGWKGFPVDLGHSKIVK